MEKFLDLIAELFWYSMFLTPIFTVPLTWKIKKLKKEWRIFIGLMFAIVLTISFFLISWAIAFRNGMGPT